VWRTVLGPDVSWLIDQTLALPPKREAALKLLAQAPASRKELALHTLLTFPLCRFD